MPRTDCARCGCWICNEPPSYRTRRLPDRCCGSPRSRPGAWPWGPTRVPELDEVRSALPGGRSRGDHYFVIAVAAPTVRGAPPPGRDGVVLRKAAVRTGARSASTKQLSFGWIDAVWPSPERTVTCRTRPSWGVGAVRRDNEDRQTHRPRAHRSVDHRTARRRAVRGVLDRTCARLYGDGRGRDRNAAPRGARPRRIGSPRTRFTTPLAERMMRILDEIGAPATRGLPGRSSSPLIEEFARMMPGLVAEGGAAVTSQAPQSHKCDDPDDEGRSRAPATPFPAVRPRDMRAG